LQSFSAWLVAAVSMSKVNLPAQLRHPEAMAWIARVDAALRAAAASDRAPVAIDCAAMQNFDSTALAVLLEGLRCAAATAVSLTVVNPPAKLRQLAVLYGCEDLLFATVPTAPTESGEPRHPDVAG
jgi:phospholipid transport system transporter-binding protein